MATFSRAIVADDERHRLSCLRGGRLPFTANAFLSGPTSRSRRSGRVCHSRQFSGTRGVSMLLLSDFAFIDYGEYTIHPAGQYASPDVVCTSAHQYTLASSSSPAYANMLLKGVVFLARSLRPPPSPGRAAAPNMEYSNRTIRIPGIRFTWTHMRRTTCIQYNMTRTRTRDSRHAQTSVDMLYRGTSKMADLIVTSCGGVY